MDRRGGVGSKGGGWERLRRRVEESYGMSSVSGTMDYGSKIVSDRLHIEKHQKILE